MDEKIRNEEVYLEEEEKDSTPNLEPADAEANAGQEPSPEGEEPMEKQDLGTLVQELKRIYDPYWREEAKKAFAARDELKEKLRQLEASIEERIAEAVHAERERFELIRMLDLAGCIDSELAMVAFESLLAEGLNVQDALDELKRSRPHLFATNRTRSWTYTVQTHPSPGPNTEDLRTLAAQRYKV